MRRSLTAVRDEVDVPLEDGQLHVAHPICCAQQVPEAEVVSFCPWIMYDHIGHQRAQSLLEDVNHRCNASTTRRLDGVACGLDIIVVEGCRQRPGILRVDVERGVIVAVLTPRMPNTDGTVSVRHKRLRVAEKVAQIDVGVVYEDDVLGRPHGGWFVICNDDML